MDERTDTSRGDETRRAHAERLMRTLVHIERHLDEPADLSDLARRAHFSAHHFHRIFTAGVGESVAAYRRRLLLERAAAELSHSRSALSAIARRAGYSSVEAFGRAFKRAYGVTPAAFRARLSESWLEPGHETDEAVIRNRISARLCAPSPIESAVEVRWFEGARVASVRHVGPYHRVGLAWARLMVWAGARGAIGRGTRHFGIAHDDPSVTEASALRYDACVTVSGRVRGSRGVSIQEIPASRCAVAEHRGGFGLLPSTYEHIFGRWLPSSGWEADDQPSFIEICARRIRPRATDRTALVHVPVRDGRAFGASSGTGGGTHSEE